MLRAILDFNGGRQHTVPKEGDLFKVIKLYGRTFEIRYGFYEERDRYTPLAEPVAIYPDFAANPQYSEEGIPFVTEMQALCPYFTGKKSEDSCCGDCAYYVHGDELLGTCSCPQNQKTADTDKAV